MRNTIKSLALASVFVLGAGTAANAALFTLDLDGKVSTAPGTDYTTTGITGAIVTGENMGNGVLATSLQVSAFFADGSSETVPWGPIAGLPAGDGRAVGAGFTWFLYEQGPTIGDTDGTNPRGIWSLYNLTHASPIVKLELNARPGGITFDVIQTPDLSPGSEDGNAFRNNNAYGTQCTSDTYCAETNVSTLVVQSAQYLDRLIVGGVDYGDEFTFLRITFSSGLGASAAGCTLGNTYNVDSGTCNRFNFVADTDFAASEIVRRVPEPMTLALFGSGLLGLGALRRRRKAVK